MVELFQSVNIFCKLGNATATILTKNGLLRDGTGGFVSEVCKGCTRWTTESIRQTELDVFLEERRIAEENRVRLLTQLIVDRSRLKGGDKDYVVANCEPFGS